MKKLGLVGGLGPQSTITYYRDVVYGVQERMGKPYFPNLTIESLNAFTLMELSSAGKLADLADYLMVGIDSLVASGADFAALACNTGHIVFQELAARSPIPLISIVQATCDEAVRRKYDKIALLGTRVTMDGDFFHKPFTAHGIDIIVPTEKEKRFLDGKIDTELEFGIFTPETRQAFLHVVERMGREDGIQGVILGCTEIPLLLEGASVPVPSLDTVRIHIDAIVEQLMAEEGGEENAVAG